MKKLWILILAIASSYGLGAYGSEQREETQDDDFQNNPSALGAYINEDGEVVSIGILPHPSSETDDKQEKEEKSSDN